MAVIREYNPPRAKRRRIIGFISMPDGSVKKFKGHEMSEVRQRYERAKAKMEAQMERKAARIHQIAEYNRQRREVLSAHGICQDCGREDAEPGRILCWACRLYRNQRRSGAQQAPLSPYKNGLRAR
ncbi:MAG: hypothetical protein HDQ90_08570 [Desulfovibrio sp.]|nr:hypothetical protein [Desulfovibrio sp.]